MENRRFVPYFICKYNNIYPPKCQEASDAEKITAFLLTLRLVPTGENRRFQQVFFRSRTAFGRSLPVN